MNKQQLAQKIWESANKMRSKIEANEYKDYILGFIFYKYLSDNEIKFLKENDFSDEDIKALDETDTDTTVYIQENLGYFIAYKDLFSTWLAIGNDFSVANVRDALSAFSRFIHSTHRKVFDNIFHTLDTGLSKLGDNTGNQTKAISALVQLIKDIPMDGKQGYDVLGFVYEYLISMFAANAGKKAGEFYTPHEVSLLMSEIVAAHLKDKTEIKIYDPTSGSGSLLINIGKSVAKYINQEDKIQYYAQEWKENTYNLTRMNLIMRGISPANIFTRNADTLEDDWPFFDETDPINSYNPLYVDAVVSNPPYSQAWDTAGKENDPRYARFGLAPKTKADYAFLLHDLFHVRPDGIMTIVLPHGVLFRGGEEGAIRKNLIESNNIDAIIGLPANIFFGTGIPTIIIVLKQNRPNTDVLIVDASKGFIKEGKNNKLRASDIKRIADTVIGRETTPHYSKLVSREEIRQNEYNLNIPRYVDSSEKAEAWDIYASMFGGIPCTEIDDLDTYWLAFPNLKKTLFSVKDIPYAHLQTENIRETIKEHADIQAFSQTFHKAFQSFHAYLKKELFTSVLSVNVSQQESVLSQDIFQRLENMPLIDKYTAFQQLHDEWVNIAIDLEIIQTEGVEAIKKVDPHMVLKKKNGTEQEVQEGWLGRILPFELVQENLLKTEKDALKAKENRLPEIEAELEALIEEMSEEEKELDILNEAKDAFIPKDLSKYSKELKADKTNEESQNLLKILLKAEALLKEEKELKREIHIEKLKLHALTKTTIESLNDEDMYSLLEKKWLDALVGNIYKLPEMQVNLFITKIEHLSEKYKTTYLEIESQIDETQITLSSMLDELNGDEFDMQGLNELKKLLGA